MGYPGIFISFIQSFIHSFILETYIAPLQEALPAQSRTKKKNFREMVEEQSKSDARVERRH